MALLPGNVLTENQQSIETDIDGWANFLASSSSTIRSTTQAHDGTASMRATYNGTPSDAMASLTDTDFVVTVTAGTVYDFNFWVYSPRAVQFHTLVDWYAANNSTYVDTTVGTSSTASVNTWTQIGAGDFALGTHTAPVGAARARVYLMCNTGLTTGDLIYFDTVFFGTAPPTSPYTVTASGSWTAPDGITAVQVECWGGGGAGGGGRTNTGASGGGGAGGCYVLARSYSVTPGNTYTVTVGAGGAFSTGSFTNGSVAGSGGDSWFDSTSGTVAKGGVGGVNRTSSVGAGGVGSTTGCIGDVVYAGGDGAAGVSTIGGGGGGGAGSTGVGGSASGSTAGAGTATGGGSGSAGVTTANATDGSAAGGGGGGARANNTTTIRRGGNGARGQVVLTWPVSTPANNVKTFTTAVRRASTW